MADASQVFPLIAGFLSKLGLFVALPAGVIILIVARKYTFETNNARDKVMDKAKLALMAFAGLQLPQILVWFLHK